MNTRPKALLIEDDSFFLEIVRLALDKRGFDVTSVTNFEDGLAAIDNGVYSFVMTDIFMPGMGGIEGIKILKDKFPALPVIAISGGWADLDPAEAIKAAKKIGADAGVRKPISIVDFNLALDEIGRGKPLDSI